MISEGLLDFVAMDLKTSLARYAEVAKSPVDPDAIKRSIRAITGSGIEHEFRCTVVPGLVGLDDLGSLAEIAEGARMLVLQQFRSENTLDPEYRGAKGYPEETLLEWAEKLSALIPTRVRGLVGAPRD
jgi:pyruvate formate lyase activating enzyme